MRVLAAVVRALLILAVACAWACGGTVAVFPGSADASVDAPPVGGSCPSAPPAGRCTSDALSCNYECAACTCASGNWRCSGLTGCAASREPEPVEGAPCGVTDPQACCAVINPSHVGETRSFACPSGRDGVAVCAPKGKHGEWHVTASCERVVGSACDYSDDPSPGAVTAYGTCGEGVNIAAPPATNCGGVGAAFEYVPRADVVVSRLELFTTPGVVALLDSDGACDKPGKVLFQSELDSAATAASWRGANVAPTIKLTAHHKYFLFQGPGSHGSMSCSVAQQGVQVREYTGPLTGPWAGPFSGLAWMGRVVGACPCP